jgi:hypothetical protein
MFPPHPWKSAQRSTAALKKFAAVLFICWGLPVYAFAQVSFFAGVLVGSQPCPPMPSLYQTKYANPASSFAAVPLAKSASHT